MSPLQLSLDVSAVPARPVGAGRYTIDLANALARRSDVDLVLWSRRSDAARWSASGPRGGRSLEVRSVVPDRRPARLVWEQVRMSSALGQGGIDVHHGPHYTMPAGAPVPVVVTIHDLTFLDRPEWHERTKVPVFRRAIRVAAGHAAAVVCVSDTTARRFRELCRPRAEVFVAPHGVDHHRFYPPGHLPGGSEADELLRSRHGVRQPYVCFVGTLEPRKAVPELVAAFDALAAVHGELQLVLAGSPGWGARAVEQAIGHARHGARVVRTGYVDDESVAALLRGAAVVAYPALEEGFGLPALEALACGAPLVTTLGTAMAELAGDAALLVPSGDQRALIEVLVEALEGGPGAERRQRAGIDIARHHTWEASAERHMMAYRWAATNAR